MAVKKVWNYYANKMQQKKVMICISMAIMITLHSMKENIGTVLQYISLIVTNCNYTVEN